MPEKDVSDLRDVVDAINKLCETMKTTYDEDVFEDSVEVMEETAVECSETLISPEEIVVETVEVYKAECWRAENQTSQPVRWDMTSPETVNDRWSDTNSQVFTQWVNAEKWGEAARQETVNTERWSDTVSQVSMPCAEDVETVTSDTEPAPCEPVSEMYYTASSEVSLLSDEMPDKMQDEDKGKEDKKECVIAGHVAAMRERFESMTRTNTPCPDLIRSTSPSFDVFRNITPSPDRLG